jgi:hypothetical protein
LSHTPMPFLDGTINRCETGVLGNAHKSGAIVWLHKVHPQPAH